MAKCARCGERFYQLSFRHEYCSEECRKRVECEKSAKERRARGARVNRPPGSGSISSRNERPTFQICIAKVLYYERIHRIIVMYALDRQLKWGEEVHHNDGNPLNNKPSNLAYCNNSKIHKKLDNYSRVRKDGIMIEEFPLLDGVIWIKDLLSDDPDPTDDAIAWWVNKIMVWDLNTIKHTIIE